MKKVMMILSLMVLFVIMVSAQDNSSASSKKKNNFQGSTIEFELENASGELSPQVKIYLTYKGKNKLGFYCWGQASRSYSQVYCGPTYSPKGWFQVGFGAGLETAKKPVRSGGFVWTGKGRFSNLLVIEKGGSGLWYRNVSSAQVGKNVTLSFVTQRFSGTGGRIDLVVPTTKLSLSAEYQIPTSTSRFGVRYNF